jgi:hypothetical protein
MATFTIRLVERLRTKFTTIPVFAEAFPAPKTTGEQKICVISSGESPSRNEQRTTNYHSKRIVVSGTAKTAMDKAEEVWRYFVPVGDDPETGFVASEYKVLTIATEKRPSLIANVGNSFIAEFQLRFFVAE